MSPLKKSRRWLFFRKLLLESVSCYDTAGESFYHGLVLGFCAITNNRYYITSNRESGEGRYDIQLMPRDIANPGILIELKAAKNCSGEELKALAQTALQQINDKKYDTDITAKGVQTIFKYGVAFSGKEVEVSIGKMVDFGKETSLFKIMKKV